MKSRSLPQVLVLSLLATCLFAACGAEEEVEAVDTTPHVGLFEIPISRNNQASEPSDVVRIEVTPTELRLNYETLLELERGRPAESEVAEHIITRLRAGIQGSAARRRASIRMHATVPYITLVDILNTLQSASLRDVYVAVRTPAETPAEAWMQLPHWQVVAAGADATFEGAAPRWDTFVEHWRAVYDACRAGQYVDCDGPYTNTAAGGDLDMELWTRGQGMKVTFSQGANAAEAEPSGGGGVAMIEGIAAAPAAPTEEEGTPATGGAFTLRHQEATLEGDSALSSMVAPVCADQQCRAVFVTDATTASMRVISMLGAVFPNGTERPQVAFRIPQLRRRSCYIVSESIPIDLPDSNAGDESPPPTLTVLIDAEGQLYIDAEEVTWEELRTQARRFSAEEGGARAVITAERQVSHGELIHIVDILRDEGITRYAINVNPQDLER